MALERKFKHLSVSNIDMSFSVLLFVCTIFNTNTKLLTIRNLYSRVNCIMMDMNGDHIAGTTFVYKIVPNVNIQKSMKSTSMYSM